MVNALKSNIREERLDVEFYQKKVYKKYLKIRVLKTWIKLQNFIKAENSIIAEQQSKIVAKFRKIKLCRKALEALSDHAQNEKICAEKNLYKHKMWSKVNQWLTDLDQKEVEEQSTDEKMPQGGGVSFMSKDMFDEGFEFTKDDMSKTIGNDTIELN